VGQMMIDPDQSIMTIAADYFCQFIWNALQILMKNHFTFARSPQARHQIFVNTDILQSARLRKRKGKAVDIPDFQAGKIKTGLDCAFRQNMRIVYLCRLAMFVAVDALLFDKAAELAIDDQSCG